MKPVYYGGLKKWLIIGQSTPYKLYDWATAKHPDNVYNCLCALNATILDDIEIKNGVAHANWFTHRALAFETEADALNFIEIMSDPNLVKLL